MWGTYKILWFEETTTNVTMFYNLFESRKVALYLRPYHSIHISPIDKLCLWNISYIPDTTKHFIYFITEGTKITLSQAWVWVDWAMLTACSTLR